MVSLTFRTTGSTQWTGKGSALESSEVDQNFADLASTIEDLAGSITTIEGLTSTSLTESSGVAYLYGALGTLFGSFNIPEGLGLIASSSALPSSDDGRDGESYLYIQSTYVNLYSPKSAGAWPAAIDLKGPQGEALLQSSDAPSSADGAEGDSWIEAFNGSTFAYLYAPKGSTGWGSSAVIDLKGETGASGTNGADGQSVLSGSDAPSSGDGDTGDLYVHTYSGSTFADLYGPKVSTGWPATPDLDLKGEQGTSGDTGNDGLSILSGSDAPSSGDGNTGDLYVHTYSGSTFADLYGPKVSTGWPASADIDLRGDDGLGVPAGGLTGYYLRKQSTADNDTDWEAGTVPTATESVEGGLEIATTAEVLQSSLDDKIVTPEKLDAWAGETAVLQGEHALYVPASAMESQANSGAAFDTYESTVDRINLEHYAYDPATAEYAQFKFFLPKSWDVSAITAQPLWTAASSTGDVRWLFEGVALSDDDSVETSFGTAAYVLDSVTSSLDLMVGAESSAITIAGSPASSDLVVFQIGRDAASSLDTCSADARLIGVVLYPSLSASNDE